MASLSPFRTQLIGPAAAAVRTAAAGAESWALKGPTVKAEAEAFLEATKGGMVVGDLAHIALRSAEMYGFFCIGEMIGRGEPPSHPPLPPASPRRPTGRASAERARVLFVGLPGSCVSRSNPNPHLQETSTAISCKGGWRPWGLMQQYCRH